VRGNQFGALNTELSTFQSSNIEGVRETEWPSVELN